MENNSKISSGMILAVCVDGPYRGLIGVGNALPWTLPRIIKNDGDENPIMNDSQLLRYVTMQHHHLIAGAESIPSCGYPSRTVHIASRSTGNSIEKLLREYPGAIVCGGVEIYHAAANLVDVLYITRVSGFTFSESNPVPSLSDLKCVDIDMILSNFPVIVKTIPLAGTAILTVYAEIRTR